MATLIGTTLTGLLSFQRSLATTSHNIANVNTEGYSRQRVNLTALPAENIGGSIIGRGVSVNSIERVLDGFQVAEVQRNVTQQGRLEVFSQLSQELDSLLGSRQSGLSPALLGFFEGVQAAADDPSSTAARQSLLSQANVLADRLTSLDERLAAQQTTLRDRLSASVPAVNALAASLANLNSGIIEASAVSGGVPNDLLDQREQVLAELSAQLSVEAVPQDDGSINVFIGSGQALVLGGDSSSLRFGSGEFGQSNPDLFLDSIAGTTLITSNLSGGEIGGLLDANRELIAPSRNQLGQLSLALGDLANKVHSGGLTLNGELGGLLFNVGEPKSFQSSKNTGNAELAVSVTEIGELTASDYQLQINSGSAQLIRLDNQTDVPLQGSGTALDPYVADGLEIVLSGTAADGDSFLIQPTLDTASDFSLAITNPTDLALAGPVTATRPLTNTGTVEVDSLGVLDSENPSLLNTVEIEFLSATTYSVDGAGVFAYDQDTPIDINGWTLELNGIPAQGDSLRIEVNAGGVGDNRNALVLGGILEQGVLEGGSISVEGAYSGLLSTISTGSQQAQIQLEAQSSITEQSMLELESVSGVNLDEEAANMVRFQQAYQAAAQMLGVADSLFQTLIGAVRR